MRFIAGRIISYVCLVFFISSILSAQDACPGKILLINGSVEIDESGDGHFRLARENDPLYLVTRVRTAPDAYLEIILNGKSVTIPSGIIFSVEEYLNKDHTQDKRHGQIISSLLKLLQYTFSGFFLKPESADYGTFEGRSEIPALDWRKDTDPVSADLTAAKAELQALSFDSALQKLNKAGRSGDKESSSEILFLKGYACLQSGFNMASAYFCRQAFLCIRSHDRPSKNYYFYDLLLIQTGFACYRSGLYPDSITALKEYINRTHSDELGVNAYWLLVQSLRSNGQNKEAAYYEQQALKLFEGQDLLKAFSSPAGSGP